LSFGFILFLCVVSNYYRSVNLREYYNWIIYFDRTTASEVIPRY